MGGRDKVAAVTRVGDGANEPLHRLGVGIEPDCFVYQIARLLQRQWLIVGEEIGWDLKNFTMDITSCWAVVNGKLASNFVHNHPNSVLSGVYYVKAPENCGGIFFRDARDVAHMFVPTVAELSPWTLQKVTYAATEGRMLIFPSWLNHGVEPNLSEEDRICVSFNIGMSHSKC